MKTAISIPDRLFKKADKTAKLLGISRSNLYQKALKEYIDNISPQDITRKLDAVYSFEESKLDDSIFNLQYNSLDKENW